jgi:glucose-1-phosphate cytidylyltransferase
MKIYSHHGINDFVVCLGYRGYAIKEYFANYFLHTSDVTFDMVSNRMEVHERHAEPWRVTLVDTGPETQTGGRLKRVQKYMGDETFCFTYGDGVTDLNIGATIDFHRAHGREATVTAIQPPGRYGSLNVEGSVVRNFQEKPAGDGAWINAGFFVLEPSVFGHLQGDQTSWETQPLQDLSQQDQLRAYMHKGFWQAMDTLRDKNQLEELWQGTAPWKVWK